MLQLTVYKMRCIMHSTAWHSTIYDTLLYLKSWVAFFIAPRALCASRTCRDRLRWLHVTGIIYSSPNSTVRRSKVRAPRNLACVLRPACELKIFGRFTLCMDREERFHSSRRSVLYAACPMFNFHVRYQFDIRNEK